MDTADELVAHAARQGVSVSSRQIEEWNKDGLLPTPNRERTPGQGRGRPKYRYPEPAQEVVVWLGMHRRFINGADAAKLWMWLEGFAYIDVDVNAVIRDHLAAAWNEARETIPSLPDLSEMPQLAEEQREVLLDEIDVNVTAPLLERGLPHRDVPKITIGAALLGIDMGDLLSDLPALGGVPDADDVKPWSDYLVEEGEDLEAAREVVPRIATEVNFVEVFRAASAQTIHPVLLGSFWQMQKRMFPELQSMRKWKYGVVKLAVAYLSFQRIFLPMYLPAFQVMLEIMTGMLREEPDLPPRLREKLDRLALELKTPEVRALARDIKRTLKADQRMRDQVSV